MAISARQNDLLIVSNSSDKALAASLWISDSSGKRRNRPLALAAHQTRRLDVREMAPASYLAGTFGGITVEVPTNAGALHSIHFAYDETAKTSAFLKMFGRVPAATLSERIAPGSNRPWMMWAPMLPLRTPDPALGLPTGTLLHPNCIRA